MSTETYNIEFAEQAALAAVSAVFSELPFSR